MMQRYFYTAASVVRKCAVLMHLASSAIVIPITIMVILASFMRYGVRAPFAFTEEVVGLLLISMLFLGLPHITLRDSHIKVTLLFDLATPRLQGFLRRIGLLVTAFFFAWFGLLTLDYMQVALDLSARTAGSRLLLWPWTVVLPLSCAVSFLSALVAAVLPAIADDDLASKRAH